MEVKRYPKKIMASFQLGNLIGLMFSQLYAIQMPAFFLDILGLDVSLYFIALIIFTLVNMFNDPILGHLSDRSTRFTKRWGKRFPFIIMGVFPWALMPIFFFAAPSALLIGQFGLFFWYLIVQCTNDTAFSLFDVNRIALFPDKFREPQDRKIAGFITVILETVGVILGVIIPILILELMGPGLGYFTQAIIISVIGIILIFFMIPGVREDEEMKQRRAQLNVSMEKISFFKNLFSIIKDKNLIAYIALYTCYGTTMGIVMGSVPWFVQDILLLPVLGELIVIFYILAVFPGAYLWYKLSLKIGIKKVALLGGILMFFIAIPIISIPYGPDGLPIMIIVLLCFGVTDGAIISMTMPLFSAIIDAAAIRTGQRKEGLYNGTNVFFNRISIAINALVYWIVRTLSGYELGATEPLQLFGLRMQMSIFPMIFMFIGSLLFWKFYRLTEEKINENALKLTELKL
ncbi:MAG: MFS transporter [Candidatus Lokiarchaeota archaeon]|nr:MFS transporter [Candidatus Lokiarchaeota archaeon]